MDSVTGLSERLLPIGCGLRLRLGERPRAGERDALLLGGERRGDREREGDRL